MPSVKRCTRISLSDAWVAFDPFNSLYANRRLTPVVTVVTPMEIDMEEEEEVKEVKGEEEEEKSPYLASEGWEELKGQMAFLQMNVTISWRLAGELFTLTDRVNE